MRNMFPGVCYKCGCRVPTGFGFFERCNPRKNGGKRWRVQCVKCADGRIVSEDDEAVRSTENRRDKWMGSRAGRAE